MEHSPRRDRAQVVLSALLLALAAFIAVQTQLISADGGYSAVGPRFSPLLVAAGLAVVGLVLLRQALTGGWRGMDGAAPPEPFHAPAFGWIAGGLALHMAIIGSVGFTLASALLFVMVARGFGSRRLVHDVGIGFVLAVGVFLFFTRVLGLALPALVAGIF